MKSTLLIVLLLSSVLCVPAQTQNVFEDDEIKITIPAGWTRTSNPSPSIVERGPSDKLVLFQKDNYTLALFYRTEHASGINGGRFLEGFKVPWLSTDQADACDLSLTDIPQPVNRALLFENILIDSGVPKVRANCKLSAALRPERRWYGGYFSPAGSYFIDQPAGDCESKLYSLTTAAKKPGDLPAADDPRLEQVIQEAIDIVANIQYKHCGIRPEAPGNMARIGQP